MPLWPRKDRPVEVHYGAQSDVGRIRDHNEDALGYAADGDEYLFVVADGMGGHEGGEQASALAVETVRMGFARNRGTPADRLRASFRAANAHVHERARASGAVRGMGTTCTALALIGDEAFLAHVGDSRAYRVDRAGIRQLTDDHTLVHALTRDGVITEDEAARHPQRHALTRAIGIQPDVEVDVRTLKPPRRGDAFVLCSDGLAEVQPDEIRDVVRRHEPQEAADALVAMANERGGADNITALVIRIG